MSKKVIKDVFLKQKKEIVPLNKELEKERKNKKRIFLRVFIFLAAVVLAAGFGYAAVGEVSSAVVNVTPHQESAEVDSLLKADGRSAELSGKEEGLFFETIKMEIEESEAVIPTGISGGGQKASGKVVIYNNYGSAAQNLVASTRFETADGKIYRIQKAVTVPGMGSIEAVVYADQPGPDYNIAAGDSFKLPGLKGGPRYEKVFAKSKNDFKGGAKGNSLAVRKEDIEAAKKAINEKIKKRMVDYFYKQKPQDYVLYSNAIKIEYSDGGTYPKLGEVAGGTAGSLVKMKGRVTGYLFTKKELSRSLLNSNIRKLKMEFQPEEVIVDNLEDLNFNLMSVDAKNNQLKISVKGDARFVWDVDTEKLLGDLMERNGKNYTEIFKNYPGIYGAKITWSPSWWKKLPKNKDKIKVNVSINNN